MKKTGDKTCSTWQTNVREIVEALGIEATPNQYVTIDNGDGDGRSTPMSGRVIVSVWESFDA